MTPYKIQSCMVSKIFDPEGIDINILKTADRRTLLSALDTIATFNMEGKAAKHWDTLRNNVLKTNQERHTAMEEAACSVLSQKGVVGAETEEKPAQEEEAPEPKSLGTYQEVVGSMAEKEPVQGESTPSQ
ncbi:hypothetical protein ED733_003035 [Metarhizium rileyi]|uniref:Uncharacterized protein n=1 Tax=Metarhizium rileyi (strain RCEF 4871) TaxID=1649241 RepID=A0A5C6G7W3_METRR|nr:hypothetical protein ED733_003035 [Metarhizium rileyi]